MGSDKKFILELPLKVGDNVVQIVVTGGDGTTKDATGQCKYEPEVQTTVR